MSVFIETHMRLWWVIRMLFKICSILFTCRSIGFTIATLKLVNAAELKRRKLTIFGDMKLIQNPQI